MGTRHLQTIISKKGDVMINQYGQWDGYPEGQGLDILHYLRGANLEKYQKNLHKIKQATKECLNAVVKNKDWPNKHPYLSRDCGAKIHQMIEDGKVKFVVHMDNKNADWCEGFYTIDFQKELFTSEFYGIKKSFHLSTLPTDEDYLYAMNPHDEEENEE